MIPLTIWVAALASELSPASGRHLASSSCKGDVVNECSVGWTGPECDIQCRDPGKCSYARYCHSWGPTYSFSTFGTLLFEMDPAGAETRIALETQRFILEHPGTFSLARGLRAQDLRLAPAPDFRSDAGRLTIFRYHQSYRQYPVFPGDGVVTVIADPRGAISIRGSIVDNRVEFAFAEEPASSVRGEASILHHAEGRSGIVGGELVVVALRLVAFPRLKTIGWVGTVKAGAAKVATVVVAADPESKGAADILPLLYYSEGLGQGLNDEVPIVARIEDPSSDIFTAPVQELLVDRLYDGGPLLGSSGDLLTLLGTERVVVLDATNASGDSTGKARSLSLLSPIYGKADGAFDASADAPEFDFQDAYFRLNNMYELTNKIMAGRWESLVGLTPQGMFVPRLVVPVNAPIAACKHQGWCVVEADGNGLIDPPDALDVPVGGPPYEKVAAMFLEGTPLPPMILEHEFGHFVDNFSKAGILYDEHACAGCESSCEMNTPDEALPLTETTASLLALWYARNLYPAAGDSSACAFVERLSNGNKRLPHNKVCRPDGNGFGRFLRDDDPRCPGGTPDPCDRPESDDVDESEATALCDRSLGYKVDSFFHAFWELLHAETCATHAPYVCTALPALAESAAEDSVGRALLYAMRTGAATYEGFVDDVLTYISCNHGEAAYREANEVLCHHNIRDDALDPQVCLLREAPTLCDVCGNGIREQGEACDGGDLGGTSCEDFGLASGVLQCDADCIFTLGECLPAADPTEALPTTSAGPTSDTEAFPSESGSEGDSVTAPGDADGGCACRSGPVDAGSQSTLALAALLGMFRRRRERLAMVASSLLLVGCTGETAQSTTEVPTTDAPTTDVPTTDVTSEAGAEEVPGRFFGAFHYDVYDAGDVFVDDPDDEVVRVNNFSNFEISPDGFFRFAYHGCTYEPYTFEYAWTWDAETQTMHVSAEGSASAPFIDLHYTTVDGISVRLGEGCDDLVVTIADDDQEPAIDARRAVPGELCAVGTECSFTLEWCEGPPSGCTRDR